MLHCIATNEQAYALANVSAPFLKLKSKYMQWRAEGDAEGATAPGIHPGGIQKRSFLKKCIGKCRKSKVKCVKSEERPRASRIRGASGKMLRKKK